MEDIIAQFSDPVYYSTISECLGFIPVGVVLGVIAWAFGYVVVIFLQTVKKAV